MGTSLATYIRIIEDDEEGRRLPMQLHLPGFQSLGILKLSLQIKKIGFHKWESVKCCIHGLTRLDLCSIIRLCRVSVYRNKCIVSSNCFLLHYTFWTLFLDSPGSE